MGRSTVKRTSTLRIFFSIVLRKCLVKEAFNFLCRVARSEYLNTEEFIDAVAMELRIRLFRNAKL